MPHPIPASFSARLAGAALCAMACSAAAADGAPTPGWSLGGFGSLGLTHASIRSADFTSSIMKYSGAGHTDRWSPHVDTRIGLQADLAIGQEWSAVVQAVSEQRSDGSYRPVLEWANLRYQATPGLALRVGRIALPIFLAADYRKVGYAYPWVRPPVEVYNAIPLTNSDGVDASYRWRHGAVKNVTEAFYGRTRKALWDNATLDAVGVAGISHTASAGNLSVRASALTGRMTIDIARPLFDAYRQYGGAAGAALAERYDVDGRRVRATSLGLNYDPGAWFVMAELGRIKTGSYLGDTYTGYASAGYRLGDLTPHVSWAAVDPDSPTRDPGLAPGALPAPLRPAAALANARLNWLLSTIAIQSTVSLGARWDLSPGAALKVQYDRTRPSHGSRGSLVNVQDDFTSDQTVHVASVVLDFVF